MAVIISMLRGVNVGSHNRVKMDVLRPIYESLKLRDPQTYVQSGNVVFHSGPGELAALARRIERAIQKTCGFSCAVILRTLSEMRGVVTRNPFAGRDGIEPGKLLVTFLAGEPGPEAPDLVRRVKTDCEELKLIGRELFVYFPNGMGRSKLSMAAVEKAIQVPGTGRNWNSVTNLLEIAEKMEGTTKKQT